MKEFKIDNEYNLKLNEDGIWDTFQNGNKLPHEYPDLYKFYSLNIYNIDSLLRNYFYLAKPSDFNDPFDCNINLIENNKAYENLKTVKRNVLSNVGISSLTEIIDSPLMWAHYTSNYKGFALNFGNRIDILLREHFFSKYTITRVIYPEKPVRIKESYPFAQNYLMTTKFKHWQYEKEWRIICDLKDKHRELEYVPELVKGLYIGHNIPDENPTAFSLLLEIHELRFPKTPIYVVYPHPTELKLNFEKVWESKNKKTAINNV